MRTRNGEDSIQLLRQSVYSGDFDKYSFNSQGLEWHQKKKFELGCEWRNLRKPQTHFIHCSQVIDPNIDERHAPNLQVEPSIFLVNWN